MGTLLHLLPLQLMPWPAFLQQRLACRYDAQAQCWEGEGVDRCGLFTKNRCSPEDEQVHFCGGMLGTKQFVINLSMDTIHEIRSVESKTSKSLLRLPLDAIGRFTAVGQGLKKPT